MSQSLKALGIRNIEARPILDDITVVIPTIGRSILEKSLNWIAAGSAWPARIIIVDQSANPMVAAWLANFRSRGVNAEHVLSSQRGRAVAVNRGIERVRTRFAAVTDDDCFVDHNWLQNMAARLRETPEAIITGRVEPEGEEEVLTVSTSLTPTIQHRPLLKHDSMCGGNMGVAMAVVERIGMLDEDPRLSTAEDCEYSYRALQSGVPIIYAPEVSVRHYGWRDVSERAAQYESYARSHGAFYGKYLRKGDWFIALRVLIHHLRALRRWMRGVMTGNQDISLYGRAYVTGLLPGIISGFRKGERS